MAALLTAPYSQFFDANGVPLNGGKIYTYAAGTTTPQASYTDSSAGTPAANPVILDSAGRAAIWLSGTYKIKVNDSADNTLYTTDNITPAGSSASTTFTDSTFLIIDDGDATKKAAFQASGITTATTRTFTFPDKNGTIAMTSDVSGKVTCFQVIDTTDISLSTVPTQANVGATKSITIPTKGVILLNFSGELISSVATGCVILGIRIGSTNYFPKTGSAGADYLVSVRIPPGTYTFSSMGSEALSDGHCVAAIPVYLDIERLSIPSGVQTVQVIAAKDSSSTSTLKGTVITSRVYLAVFDHS